MRPTGPLPANVYWRRRAVVLGVAFILVFALARILGGGDDGGDPDRAAPASGTPTESGQQPDPTAGPTPEQGTGKGSDQAGDKKGEKKNSRKPQLAEPDGPCDVKDMTIKATVSRVASSSAIKIPLKLTTSVDACTFEVSKETVVVKITSGRDHIWSSQECRGIEAKTVVVRAAKPAAAKLIWNGRRSGIACGASAEWAKPGWYHVIAAQLGGEPTDKMFELGPRKAEVIIKPSKNDKSDKMNDEKRSDRR